jgi:LemA protein
MTGTYILLGVLALAVIITISKYNGIVALKNIRKQSFADIDVQLKLRFDLVPNLVSAVK